MKTFFDIGVLAFDTGREVIPKPVAVPRKKTEAGPRHSLLQAVCKVRQSEVAAQVRPSGTAGGNASVKEGPETPRGLKPREGSGGESRGEGRAKPGKGGAPGRSPTHREATARRGVAQGPQKRGHEGEPEDY